MKSPDENGNYHCPCGFKTPEPMTVLTPMMQHYGKLVCPMCESFLKWLPKPDKKAPPSRENKHKDLVNKYSPGYCEMCLGKSETLGHGNVLVAHHVIEYQNDGGHERSNIWILCSHCHSMVHIMRKVRDSIAGVVTNIDVKN